MHAFTAVAALSLALSASALTVLTPSSESGWTSTGTNILAWSRVSTDTTNFTAVLVNQSPSVMNGSLTLDAFVDATSLSSLAFDAPSGGFPTGSNFRVNLIQDLADPNSIYAQSDDFDITSGSSATSGFSSFTGSAPTTTVNLGSSTSSSKSTSTSTSTSTSKPSSAASSLRADAGLMGVMLVMGALMA